MTELMDLLNVISLRGFVEYLIVHFGSFQPHDSNSNFNRVENQRNSRRMSTTKIKTVPNEKIYRERILASWSKKKKREMYPFAQKSNVCTRAFQYLSIGKSFKRTKKKESKIQTTLAFEIEWYQQLYLARWNTSVVRAIRRGAGCKLRPSDKFNPYWRMRFKIHADEEGFSRGNFCFFCLPLGIVAGWWKVTSIVLLRWNVFVH